MIPSNIIVHHSLTPSSIPANQSEKSFNQTHKANGYPKSSLGWYIGYQYVIYGSGEKRQYRREDEAGAHTSQQSMNYKSVGICLAGNFDTELPTQAQVATLTALIKELSAKYKIKPENTYPHRKFATYKSCYGSRLADDWARSLLKAESMQLVKDKGTIYLVTGIRDKRKIGIADLESLGLFGDEPQAPMDTSGIPQYQTIVKKQIKNNQ